MVWFFLLFISRSSQSVDIPLQWQETCSFSELPIHGIESQFNQSGFTLRGLAVVFRHGERSGLLSYTDENCGLRNTEEMEQFTSLKDILKSELFFSFTGLEKEHLRFALFPEDIRCSSGQLTAEGALQTRKLGEYMFQRYGQSSLFSSDSNIAVSVGTTNYNRTVQSGCAFTTGFLYPLKDRLGKINFTIANNTIICFEDTCHCPYAHTLWKKSHKENLETFHEIASEQVHKIVKMVKKMPEFVDCQRPMQVFDIALTRFICRRKSLPCKEEICLTFDDLNQIANFSTIRELFRYNHKERFMKRLVDNIKAFNFLTPLVRDVERLTNNMTSTFVRITSAHDVTLAAILLTLGLEFDDPPRYTSRIVVEIYEKDASFFFRFLFNGADLTPGLKFCSLQNNSLCPWKNLIQFYKELTEMTKDTRDKCFK